jgi:hypothetical protein
MADPTSSRQAPEVFRSRVDLWLVAVALVVAVGGLAVAMTVPSTNAGLGKDAGVAIGAAAAVLVLLLFWWTYRTTVYTLDDDALDVRCAGLHRRVAYRDITGVQYSTDASSAPALSLRRLKVCYGRDDGLLISPRDREAFIAALQRRLSASDRSGGGRRESGGRAPAG